jgi:hypothetical protein
VKYLSHTPSSVRAALHGCWVPCGNQLGKTQPRLSNCAKAISLIGDTDTPRPKIHMKAHPNGSPYRAASGSISTMRGTATQHESLHMGEGFCPQV